MGHDPCIHQGSQDPFIAKIRIGTSTSRTGTPYVSLARKVRYSPLLSDAFTQLVDNISKNHQALVDVCSFLQSSALCSGFGNPFRSGQVYQSLKRSLSDVGLDLSAYDLLIGCTCRWHGVKCLQL